LPREVQQKVDAILLAHPRYGEWKAQWNADVGAPLNLYIFLRASTWADELRLDSYSWVKENGEPVLRNGKPVIDPAREAEKKAYDHPTWHFTNYPLKPPDFPTDDRLEPDEDVIFAIEHSRLTLQGQHTGPEDRAAALAWLTHVVEDIHQPLHCAAFFGPHFPYGDKGGNWFVVRTPDQEPVSLHSLWDNILGISPSVPRVLDAAHQLAADPRLAREKLPELGADATSESWALEGRALAISTVYLRGALEPAPVRCALDPATKKPVLLAMEAWNARPLPSDYLRNAVAAAKRCFALASYRLRDELMKLR